MTRGPPATYPAAPEPAPSNSRRRVLDASPPPDGPGHLEDDPRLADAALREAFEETGLPPTALEVLSEVVTARSQVGWTYTTVLARLVEPRELVPNEESTALEWVPLDAVLERKLHPAFATAWPDLQVQVRALASD